MDERIGALVTMLTPLVKPALILEVTGATDRARPSRMDSHFGGEAYAFENDQRCGECGALLDFVCQIWLPEGQETAVRGVRLMTFGAGLDCHHSPPGWGLRLYQDPSAVAVAGGARRERRRIKGSRLLRGTEVGVCSIRLRATKSLPDWDGIETWCEAASRMSLDILLDGMPDLAYEKAVSAVVGDGLKGYHQIGGYPSWIQCEQTPTCRQCGHLMDLVLTLGSDRMTNLNWTDGGAVYIFCCGLHREEMELVEQFH